MTPANALSPAEETNNVRVAARIRPLLPRERAASLCSSVTVEPESKQVIVGNRRAFAFDMAFDADSTQEMIYSQCVAPLLDSCMQGYNATILAYGQTGSGKTHTLGTGHEVGARNCYQEGIAPKLVKNSFDHFQALGNEIDFKASCSYIEIYNEEIRDLLRPDAPKHLMAVRETVDGVIQVAGIRSEACNSAEQMLRCLSDGSLQRTTAATAMNEQSSRSHSIFTIILELRLRGHRHGAREEGKGVATNDGEEDEACSAASSEDSLESQPVYRTAKFHLVDLAGSERAKRTGAIGSRLKESVSINAGLLALGNVISALGDPAKRGFHVPYRESKLTRLLQDSLGGNARTLMMVCASCAETDLEETLNTLKYAHRARNIKNKPVVNIDPKLAQLAAMQDEIEALRGELRRVSAGSDSMPSHSQLVLTLPSMVTGAEVDTGGAGLEEHGIEQVCVEERHGAATATHVASSEAECEALRGALLDICNAVHEHLPWICQGSFPQTTTTGDLPETARHALAALNVSLHAASSLLGAVATSSQTDDRDDAASLLDISAVSLLDISASGELLPGIGDLECSLSDANDSANLLRSLVDTRDFAPLIRKYLQEIRRLETELALHQSSNKRLQDDLRETRELVDQIFEEKLYENRTDNQASDDPKQVLYAELHEAYVAARRRLEQNSSRLAATTVSDQDSLAQVDQVTKMVHEEHVVTVHESTVSRAFKGSLHSAADYWGQAVEEQNKGVGFANEECTLRTPRSVASPCRARNRRFTPPSGKATLLGLHNSGEESMLVSPRSSVTLHPTSPSSRQCQADGSHCSGQGTADDDKGKSPKNVDEVLEELRRLCDEAQTRAQSAEERASEEHLRAERILQCLKELQPPQRRSETCGLCQLM